MKSEIGRLDEAKKKNQVFDYESIINGERNVLDDAQTIRNALLKKDGIVEEQYQKEFRSKLQTAFNDNVIEEI